MSARRRRRISMFGLCLLAVVTLTLGLAVADMPGRSYRQGDFFQFWAAPRLLLEGANPYDPVSWAGISAREAAPPVLIGRFAYPLWTALLLLPVGALPFGVAAAAWLVAQLTVVAVALRALALVDGGQRREAILLFGLAASFQPLWLLAGGGNVTGFLLGLFAAGLVGFVSGRPIRGGVALGLLAMKPHLFFVAVPILFLVARRGGRQALAAAAVTAVVLLGVSLAARPGWLPEWLGSALALQGTTGSNATVWTVDRLLPAGSPPAAPLLAGAAVIAFAAWRRAREPDPLTIVAGAVPISLFLAPHGWSYDQLLLLVPVAVILRRLAGVGRSRRVAGLALLAVCVGPLPWALYAVAIGRGGEEWSAVTPLVIFGLLVLVDGWEPRSAGAHAGRLGGVRPA